MVRTLNYGGMISELWWYDSRYYNCLVYQSSRQGLNSLLLRFATEKIHTNTKSKIRFLGTSPRSTIGSLRKLPNPPGTLRESDPFNLCPARAG